MLTFWWCYNIIILASRDVYKRQIEKRVGSIEVGKDADFAICDGNIMKSDSVLKYTIIDGKVVFKHEMCIRDR